MYVRWLKSAEKDYVYSGADGTRWPRVRDQCLNSRETRGELEGN